MEPIRYCSLDIETSGFDPLTNEILEVGFAFFELDEHGVAITEEWTQVFKPSKPVDPKILGLTGIRPEELEDAPAFSEFHGFIQEKLKSAAIVGHNIIFDIKFLQAFGITFEGPSIDTLELVQWILPTHHSYNLENLMHVFSVEHKKAHRALADAQACVTVLEKLLGVYQSFPPDVRKKIIELVGTKFAWHPFLSIPVPPVSVKKSPLAVPELLPGLHLESDMVYDLPASGFDPAMQAALALQTQKGKSVLAVPTTAKVLELWSLGLVEPEFMPEAKFSEERFLALLHKPEMSDDELKFCLKVLVWKETNWQHTCLLDLNLSFFGGQFRSVICQGTQEASKLTAKVIACDLATFCQLSNTKNLKNRFAVVAGLMDFEQQVSANISERAGSGHVMYLLRSYYNPELQSGEGRFEGVVVEALQKTDLFFGLVGALLGTGENAYETLKVDQDFEQSTPFLKVQSAAQNYAEYLTEANNTFRSAEIERFVNNLLNFFSVTENRVRWIEISEKRCTFFSSPIAITNLVQSVLAPFSKRAFIDAIGYGGILGYIQTRLGLTTFGVKTVNPGALSGLQALLPLVSTGLRSLFGKKVRCVCVSGTMPEQTMLKAIGAEHLPAAIVFGSGLQVKTFYEQHYEALKKYAFLAAQNNTGGANKLLRNFSIYENSVLLVTDKFLLKAMQNTQTLEPVEKLEVKTLVLCRLPFELFTHPYQEAVAKLFENPFEQYSLPRAVYNLHCLLRLFNTSKLEQVYICDSKLSKPYAKAFKEYLLSLQHYELAAETA